MTIELYVFPPSPRAFKVMALANHLGLDVTMRMVDLIKGEQKAPHYAALNPNMRMPTRQGGRLRAVGIESDPAISCRQEAGQRPIAA